MRTHGSKYGGKTGEGWLLIKERDEFARRGAKPHIVDDAARQRRYRAQPRGDRRSEHDRVWQSNRSVEGERDGRRTKSAAAEPARNEGPPQVDPLGRMPTARKRARCRRRMSPMLATLVDEPPPGDEWLHEIKYDGYRMLCRVENGKVRALSRATARTGRRTSPRSPTQLERTAGRNGLDRRRSWWCVQADGRTSFQALQNALSGPRLRRLVYFAFDLLYLDGYDLRGAPL